MTLGPSNLINSVPNTGSTAFHRGGTDPSRTHVVDECAYRLRTRDLKDRRERFEQIDALGAELVRRFRDGEVHVDEFLDSENN